MSPGEGRGDGDAVEALEADDDDATVTGLVGPPGPVEMMAHAPADTLHDEPHRLAVHRRETFDPEDAGGFGRARDLGGKRLNPPCTGRVLRSHVCAADPWVT